jgi:hypothetical protein
VVHSPSRKNIPWSLLLLSAMVVLVLIAGTYAYYLGEKESIRRDEWEKLSMIADLKASQIELWRAEQIAVGGVIAGNPILVASISAYLERSAPPDARQQIVEWMSSLRNHYGYESAHLVDSSGRRAASPVLPRERTYMPVRRSAHPRNRPIQLANEEGC